MQPLLSRRSFVSSSIATFLFHPRASADENAVGMPLSDDYSRADIFQQFVVEPWQVANASEAVTLGIPASFQFPRDVIYDCKVISSKKCVTDTTIKRSNNVMFGIDISHYTDKDDLSFSSLRDQEVRFVQMKTSQGDKYFDDKFEYFWRQVKALSAPQKVFRGPYHFLTASADGRKQADWFLSVLDRVKGLQPEDMSPGVDLEWDVYKSTGKLDHWKDKGARYIVDTALNCLERIHSQTGRLPVLYTGKSWFGPHTVPLEMFGEFSKYPLWVFDYEPRRKIAEKPLLPDPAGSAALWQFSGSARIPACYGGGLDASVFYGDENEFKKVFGIT